MTRLQAALQDLSATIKVSLSERPRPASLTKAADKLTGTVVQLPDQATTYELQKRVSDMVLAGQTSAISRRDLKLSCTTINHPPLPPAKFVQIGDALLREVATKRRRTPFYQLLGAYLATFDPQDIGTRWLATKLRAVAGHWEWRENDAWEKRIKQFDLLDVDQAPRRLAMAILGAPSTLHQLLRDVGLDGGLNSQSKLALAAFRAACAMVSTFPSDQVETAQAAVLAWNDNGKPNGRFPEGWVDICRSCLEPWKDRDPSEQHKLLILSRLQAWGGGDPRVNNHKPRWSIVEDQAQAAHGILMRWLTRASVLQFLEIVALSLHDEDDQRMWRERRAFWTSFLDRKTGPRIERAWVAFGRDAAAKARQVARNSRDPSFGNFGTHSETSRGRQHSALIMEIGDLVVVEWSHDSMCNFWKKRSFSQKLFQTVPYVSGTLYSAPLKKIHHKNWQKPFSDILFGRKFS